MEPRLHMPGRAWSIIVTRKRLLHIAIHTIVRLGDGAGTR
jgi:hypothetical protein